MSAQPQTVHRDPAAGALTRVDLARFAIADLLETAEPFSEWIYSFDWSRIGLVGRPQHSPLALFLREKGPEMAMVIPGMASVECFLHREAGEGYEPSADQMRITVMLPGWAREFQAEVRDAHLACRDLDHYSMAVLRRCLERVTRESSKP